MSDAGNRIMVVDDKDTCGCHCELRCALLSGRCTSKPAQRTVQETLRINVGPAGVNNFFKPGR